MVIGTIDLFHLMTIAAVALTLAEGHEVSGKQNLLG